MVNNTDCSSFDLHVLAALGLSTYALIIGGLVTGCRFLHCRLHDVITECALERDRHFEMIERLFLAVHDSREDLDEEDEADLLPPEQPATLKDE